MNRFDVPTVPMKDCNHGGLVKADGTLCRFEIIAVELLPSTLGFVRLAGVALRMDQMDLIGICGDCYIFSIDLGFSVLSKMFKLVFELCGKAIFSSSDGQCDDSIFCTYH
ncbi:hypothetical protein BT93_A0779 [Corymbia citriodora subsp. variegata]|nr:hypothetical protein BT93_A0779 [Corymbia citriodora subsp. variegata]